ncbi:MAG: hypothetical protein ACUVX8_14530, partial [Candidatus Zipacnadales bacterium]
MRICISIVLVGWCAVAMAGEKRAANLWWRGVSEFSQAQITNSMSASVRQPGTAGGVAMPAIFLHPQNEQRSTASFPEIRFEIGESRLLFLLTHVGIADGFTWGDKEHPADGARFYVRAGERDVLTAEVKASEWIPKAALLYQSPAGGGTFATNIALQTDCGPAANSNYDWAMFGDPLLVDLPDEPLRERTAVSGASGVLVCEVESGEGEIFVEALDADGKPIENVVAQQTISQAGMTFVRFDFGQARRCTQWQWRAEGLRIGAAWGGSWEPRLQMLHYGPTQAVILAGESIRMRVAVRNEGMGTLLPDHRTYVQWSEGQTTIERLDPGEMAIVEFDLGVRDVGLTTTDVAVVCGTVSTPETTQVEVWPKLLDLPRKRPLKAEVIELNKDYLILQNPHCRWVLYRRGQAQGALLYVWVKGRWELGGSIGPWLKWAPTATSWLTPKWEGFVAGATESGVELKMTSTEGPLVAQLHGFLPDDSPGMKVSLTLRATQDLDVLAVWGPAIHAGDRNTKGDKGLAIFPGLEYLEGVERSSSTRDLAPPLNERWTPHRFKITIPMMMVETRKGGPVVGVVWDPNQRWDGEHGQPATRFASPDFLTHQDSHLMQLGIPSVPEFIPESAERATAPVRLQVGEEWRLEQTIVAGVPEPDATGALVWFEELVGYPEAEAAPRSFKEEIELCRHAFMKTVWDAEAQKSRHVVGWASANSPGHATLLLMDARAVAEGEVKRQLLERVDLVGANTIRDSGEAGLASSALCHIMGWEFPYHWGHLPGALDGMKQAAYGAVNTQEADGGWGYYPDEKRKALGEAGTRVMGIAGRNAYLLAKWVAISGDPIAEAALRRALAHMEQYTVPRGAQGWECPILEPDVLASAYAVRAYVWTYMVTGEQKWLEKAQFWARTGLPFQYAWDDGQRPGMRYASIPVFGSTFFTHTWIGLPVQWCGLVYAYGLQELMRFDEDNLWRKQAEGITVSAMHQQWPWGLNDELTGTYPDSYGAWFTRRNPVYINPENIQLNLLALHGLDPGLRSVPVKANGGLLHVTAPGEVTAKFNNGTLTLDLKYLPSQRAYVTIAPVNVEAVIARNAEVGATLEADTAGLNILVVGLQADGQGKASVQLQGVHRHIPAARRSRASWNFQRDAEDWRAGNGCDVYVQGGSLVIRGTAEDPYALSGDVAFAANSCKQLTARVRLRGGKEVGLFWRCSISPNWGPDKNSKVSVPTEGEWREITWDLATHPW